MFGLSPTEALIPDNVAFLQERYLERRKNKAQPYIRKRAKYRLGQKVRKAVYDKKKIRQRGHSQKWSKEKYEIVRVRNTAPYSYFITHHGAKQFYEEDLISADQYHDETSDRQPLKLLSGIIQKKVVPTQFLKSGTPRAFEDVYLVTIPNQKRRYMTREQILEYSNGAEVLQKFLSRRV